MKPCQTVDLVRSQRAAVKFHVAFLALVRRDVNFGDFTAVAYWSLVIQ